MKIHLSRIPAAGLPQSISLPLSAMARLSEAIGEQTGTLDAELMLKNREGTVEVTGNIRAKLQPPCQRCLEPVAWEIEEEILLALMPMADYVEEAEDIHLGSGDLEVSFYEGEELDLTRLLEDELLLLLPEPVAEEDEEGKCLVCGKRLEDLYRTGEDDREGHPFAQLKQFLPTD